MSDLILGSRHPRQPDLVLVGWCVLRNGAAAGRTESGSYGSAAGLALFDTLRKARTKATRLGLTHDDVAACWAAAATRNPDVNP